MSAGDFPRRWTMAVRHGVSTFLAIAGVVAIVFGLMYLLASDGLPHLAQARVHASPHASQAPFCLTIGSASLVVAWLLRPRKRSPLAAGQLLSPLRQAPLSTVPG